MITQRQFIKSETAAAPVIVGRYYPVGRRRSSGSASPPVATGLEMPIKLGQKLNELESNAVRALLSLGEEFVCKQIKTEPPEAYIGGKAPEPRPAIAIARSVIVKAEPGVGFLGDDAHRCKLQQPPLSAPPPISITNQKGPSVPMGMGESHYMRDLDLQGPSGPPNKGLAASCGGLATISKSRNPSGPGQRCSISSASACTPVSIQPIVSSVSSSTAPVISTIIYQIPASVSADPVVSVANNLNPTQVMPPNASFTIIPAGSGRTTVIPFVHTGTPNATPMNLSNISNIRVVKFPHSGVDNGNTGITNFSPLAPAPMLPASDRTNGMKNSSNGIKPSPAKGNGRKSSDSSAVSDGNGKTPTKSRARRRSQSTKGQSRSSRVSSFTSDLLPSCNVEGLPTMVVDGFEISREIWAKAFLQNDTTHAAGTLFNALFSPEEIKNCTLNGRNNTRQLCPEKRQAIFKIVAWMRNKCQDPYSFNKSPEETKILSRDEQSTIEKKVFVERRYQTSRKIRDLPSSSPPPATSSPPASSINSSIAPVTCIFPTQGTNPVPKKRGRSSSPLLVGLPMLPGGPEYKRRDSGGSFSSVCSSSGDDKGIPKIALIQSSEVIANYFQSADPLPISNAASRSINTMNNHHQNDGPPPMKMQKVG